MDQQKIGISNRLFALVLSIFTALTLIISQFTFPLELILFNGQSYAAVIENEEFTERYPEIITNMLVSQIYDVKVAGTLPPIMSNRDAFQSVLNDFVPEVWSKDTISTFMNQILDYLNFRLTTNAMNIELGGLKSDLILNSQDISVNYLNSLVNCSENAFQDTLQLVSVFELPPCKPDRSQMPRFVELSSKYLEDLFNQLPSRFSISDAASLEDSSYNRFLYFYSVGRWILRLLPLLTLLLLILISALLKKEKPIMLRWVGRLLVITSAFTLILLIVALIGFDQIIAIMVNRFLGNLIEGFDVLLLGFIQEVGYLTMVWVIVSVIITLAFGFLLILMAKVFKPKKQESGSESTVGVVPSDDVQMPLKDTGPQTIEEIEGEEKKDLEAGN